ncbi:YggT family protein [Martelella sp. FLE1502]|uniref:YGGT family protein n=1 Tax=Martelella mediterranea DSM 17316 TaxID=1122214 RepID=A0A1U9Z0X1_9HYPH|nr:MULTISPECIES: YggT family protein [Martelella]AQZ51324.1 YGGT family protein [Martelella mediterranea DSM 17316]MAU21980.1 YggT family protein [Martelella sp.]MCD1636022.1 YggT family protein [Martelella mediterranea]
MIALFETIYYALEIYKWVIIASAIFSWLYAFNIINAHSPFINSIGRGLYAVTEPVYRPIRNFLPNLGGIDISPVIVLLIVFFLQRLILTGVMPRLY